LRTAGIFIALLCFVLAGCPNPGSPGDNHDHEDDYAVIPDSTKVAAPDTLSRLEAIEPPDQFGNVTLTFASSNSEIGALSTGDIVILGTSTGGPNGFIGRVSAIRNAGGKTLVDTTAAGLSDAIEEGHLEHSLRLDSGSIQSVRGLKGLSLDQSPSGSSLELNFDDLEIASGVTVRGNLSFSMDLDLVLDIDGFHCEEFTFVNTTSIRSVLTFTCGVSGSLGKKVKVGSLMFSPITVPVGPVPIVLVPVLDLYVGMNGTASIGLSTGLQQTASLKAGVTYDGSWNTVKEFASDFQWTQPTVAGACDLKGFLGPELSLLIYGVVGPYAGIHGYLELEATMADADPSWGLYGGVEFGLGVKVQALGIDLADWYADGIIDYRKQLASGHGTQSLNWQVETLGEFEDVDETGIAVDGLGRIHIVYRASEIGGTGANLYYVLYDGIAWTRELVKEYASGVGLSLCVDSLNRPHVAYGGFSGPRYAWKDQAGWHDEAIASSSNYSRPSLALDGNGKPHVTYNWAHWDNPYLNDLAYTNKTGASWSTPVAIQSSIEDHVGEFSSCAFDSLGNFAVAYYNRATDPVQCTYAVKDGSSWNIQVIDETDHPGMYVSLAFDSDRHPWVSYLRYTCHDIAVAVSDGSQWLLDQGPDDLDNYTGEYSTIAIDGNDVPHVAYYDWDTGVPKYARWRSSGWSIEPVDTSGLYADGPQAMTLDTEGRAHLAYFVWAADDQSLFLRHAKYTGPLD
jgi:hypothetical protein